MARQLHHQMRQLTLSLLLLASLAAAQSTMVWQGYPDGSFGCLTAAAKNSDCSSALSADALNACACGSKEFQRDAAACLEHADWADLSAVYTALSGKCSALGLPLGISFDQFTAASPAAGGHGATAATGPATGIPPSATVSAAASSTASDSMATAAMASASASTSQAGMSTTASSSAPANSSQSSNGSNSLAGIGFVGAGPLGSIAAVASMLVMFHLFAMF